MADTEKLFLKKWRVQVRDIRTETLRCVFKVTKHLKPDPNTIELKIYNLTEDHRKSLENIPARPANKTLAALVADLTAPNMVRLEAGYEDGMSQLYLGEVRAASTSTEGPNVVSMVTSGDGEKDLQTARINVPLGPKTSIDTALNSIVNALGCGKGNLSKILGSLKLSGSAEMFPTGGVLYGSAADELDAFCKSAQLDWSIQDGKLLILDRGKALAGTAFLLSSDTGLQESPTVDSKGIVTAKTAMIPDMFPGRAVVFDAKSLKGGYRVEECVYQGDTHGREWFIEIKCQKIGDNRALFKLEKPKKAGK